MNLNSAVAQGGPRRRRTLHSLVAVAGVVFLAPVLVGCEGPGGPPSQSADGGGTTSAPTTTTPAVDCGGLGQPPADAGGEVTWVEGGRLWAAGADGAKRCLVADVGDGDAVTWGGSADRVLVGNKVILADGRVEEPFPSGGKTVLSRPTGKSVLDVRNGKLMKRELGKAPIAITFLEAHEQTIYHPAGLHIVSTGRNGEDAVVHIATNRGEASSVLVRDETARRIYAPAFTASGALLFFADHGSYTELHRLEIDEGNLTTVAKEDTPAGMNHLVASPFEGGGVAWAQGPCDPVTGASFCGPNGAASTSRPRARQSNAASRSAERPTRH